MIDRLLTQFTHKIHSLPVLVLMPHSRCNCRCVMCDIWKANSDKKEISFEELTRHVAEFKKLKVREVVLSGGEALMHSNLWKLCALLKENGMRVTLLSTGLLLAKNAEDVIQHLGEVIVSLDGSKEIHNKIRNIPQAFEKLEEGISAIKKLKKDFRITARCVLQRYNYFDFPSILSSAQRLGLDQISFLGADVSTTAFNRSAPWANERVSEVALSKEESVQFTQLLEDSFINQKALYDSKFVAESPDKMRRIAQYYGALNEENDFPKPTCNAPWVSAVIESDGSVMPCFFHKPYGNIHDHTFDEVINSKDAIQFRKQLNVQADSICKKCVCSLKLGITQFN
jgi:Fe-coproporphyrin III synthase